MHRSGTTPLLLPSALVAMVFRSFGVLALLAVPVFSRTSTHAPAAPADRPEREHASGWKAAWSERYPGCVARSLWPADEKPVAVVLRTADGRVVRVAVGRRAPLDALTVPGRTIGACR